MKQIKVKLRSMLDELELHQVTTTNWVMDDIRWVLGRVSDMDLDQDEVEKRNEEMSKLREEYFIIKGSRPAPFWQKQELMDRIASLRKLMELSPESLKNKKHGWSERNKGRVLVKEGKEPDLIIKMS